LERQALTVIKPILDEVFIAKDGGCWNNPIFTNMVFSLKGVGQYIQTYYIGHILGLDIVRKNGEIEVGSPFLTLFKIIGNFSPLRLHYRGEITYS